MPGLVPGIHVFLLSRANNAWMAGSSPAMTRESAVPNQHAFLFRDPALAHSSFTIPH
jgi:hypothetical protein